MRRILFAFILLLATGNVSSASIDGERYLRMLIGNLSAAPGWQASARAYTSENEFSVARGVELSHDESGIRMAIDRIAIGDFQETGANAFRGSSLKITGWETSGATFTLRIPELELRDPAVPELAPVAFDASRPVTSYFKIFTSLSAIEFASAAIPEIGLEQAFEMPDVDAISQEVRYTDIAASNLSAGVLDVLTSGKISVIQTGGPVAPSSTQSKPPVHRIWTLPIISVCSHRRKHIPPGPNARGFGLSVNCRSARPVGKPVRMCPAGSRP